jgi:hypothetical protein
MNVIPQEVIEFINARCGWRAPSYQPNSYLSFKNSKTAACWGNNHLQTKNYNIAVCQPSPVKKGEIGFLLYDFELKN